MEHVGTILFDESPTCGTPFNWACLFSQSARSLRGSIAKTLFVVHIQVQSFLVHSRALMKDYSPSDSDIWWIRTGRFGTRITGSSKENFKKLSGSKASVKPSHCDWRKPSWISAIQPHEHEKRSEKNKRKKRTWRIFEKIIVQSPSSMKISSIQHQQQKRWNDKMAWPWPWPLQWILNQWKKIITQTDSHFQRATKCQKESASISFNCK